MAKPLSNTQELVELTLFDSVRKEVVSQGYLPDITLYPNTEQGYNDYSSDLIDIANSLKGFAIEVFNNSNPEYKGNKLLPRIVILSEMMVPGEVGGDGKRVYTPITDEYGNITWQGLIRPPQTVDFTFSVHVVANSAPQMRILNAIIANSLPLRGYIPCYVGLINSSVFNVFVENISFTNMTSYDQSLLESSYRYLVKDLFFEEDIPDGSYAPLVEISLANYLGSLKVRDYLIT